jgi:hypothetical protein
LFVNQLFKAGALRDLAERPLLKSAFFDRNFATVPEPNVEP